MKAIKVDDETYNLLQKLAEETQTSIKEIASRAIKAYYAGSHIVDISDKEVTKIEEKIITLKYPTKCYKCKRELKEGELAFWQRYTFSDKSSRSRILCMECYYRERTTDKQLVKLYLKRKETERLVKALKKEADRLASKIQELQHAYNIYDIKRRLVLVFDHLERTIEDKKTLYEVKEKVDELLSKISEHEEFTRTVILPRIFKKKQSRRATYSY